MREVAEPFIRRRAVRHLEKGRIVIFAAGIGQPLLTTDSAAALRALEIQADVIMKATRVGGIYTADPSKDARRRQDRRTEPPSVCCRISSAVMDASAVSLCMENGLPIVVFDMTQAGNIRRVVLGERIGSTSVREQVAAESTPTGGERMIKEIAKETPKTRMEHAIEDFRRKLGYGAHRPRVDRPPRQHHGRLLRHADAAQSGGDDPRARSLAAYGAAVRSVAASP